METGSTSEPLLDPHMSSVHNTDSPVASSNWPSVLDSLKFLPINNLSSSVATQNTVVPSKLCLDASNNAIVTSATTSINIDDCIGADITDTGLLTIHAYPQSAPKCGSTSTKPRPRTYSQSTFQLQSSDAGTLDLPLCNSTLLPLLRSLCNPSSSSNRKYLVLVNPFSGKKQGLKIAQEIVKPMLLQSNITPIITPTTHPGHATELMSSPTLLSSYDAIIAVGGDGLLYEMMQGLSHRPDSSTFLEQMPFGIVPAGSGNGLAASVNSVADKFDDTTSNVFVICKNVPKPADLSLYDTSEGNSYASFLSLSWGIVADVDLESEVLRALGSLRFDVYAVWRMIALKQYRAKLSYINCEVEMPPIGETVGEDWTTIEDNFLCFWALQTSHASQGMHTSPASKMDDGKFHLYIVRGKATRLNLLTSFLAFEDGSHVKQKHMEIIECTAFRLEPLTDNSHIDIDGEEVEYGTIQGQVKAGAWRLFY
ncbi:hypothetical protein TrVE_jg12917 [Triparma verrucosa]|nr:hypothetical protein TrVE_jg12917 [Triparma verrucosa]